MISVECGHEITTILPSLPSLPIRIVGTVDGIGGGCLAVPGAVGVVGGRKCGILGLARLVAWCGSALAGVGNRGVAGQSWGDPGVRP